ncbi:ribosome hibernation factor-recruiting GTPase MRF [Williamsia deligens]|uniref:Ribosome hibernation factor-recruiting GTPase MRF n=1 Tax=Williamsia deligens TaxID=321325 RepID=A0ABW3G856_9NOCA|nr:GTP-binding protein [Williamsia deligens]
MISNKEEGLVERTPVFVVAGLDPVAVDAVATGLAAPGTAIVHHDLVEVSLGVITRTVRQVDADGCTQTRVSRIDLDHGCVSCALRHDLLPTLRALHRRTNVDRIVVALDPLIEPEPLCWAIDAVDVVGVPGQVDGPASRDVRVEAVIGCIAAGTWLEEATGDLTLPEAGFDSGDAGDERTLSQVAVGHVAFADALVVHGAAVANWDAAVFGAVIRRLAPDVPVVMEAPGRPLDEKLVALLLSAMPLGARRDRSVGPFDPLLAGQPPLDADCGVQLVEFTTTRPFHPGRLHDALDALLEGVVCSRGRLWLATQPVEALWMESAGGGLRVATGGPWLAAMSPDELAQVDPERGALAAARWDPEFGDRHTSLVVLVHRADPDTIRAALRAACVTDAEMAAGQGVWSTWDDPFGAFHADPCETSVPHPIPENEEKR